MNSNAQIWDFLLTLHRVVIHVSLMISEPMNKIQFQRVVVHEFKMTMTFVSGATDPYIGHHRDLHLKIQVFAFSSVWNKKKTDFLIHHSAHGSPSKQRTSVSCSFLYFAMYCLIVYELPTLETPKRIQKRIKRYMITIHRICRQQRQILYLPKLVL